jgi:predicted AAA+ superfamily ATPase
VDAVHHVKNWQTEIKNIYDDYPDLSIAYSGSSMLRIDRAQGDLSRRQMVYRLDGLSFREYLAFEGVVEFPRLSLEELLADHVRIATEIVGKVKILPLFKTYLRRGYYPFYKEVRNGYEFRIREIVDEVLEKDYPAIEEVSIATIRKTRKMLMVLAASCPQTPNMSRLYQELETDRNQGLKMLSALEDAGLLKLLSTESKKVKAMSRPDKIYCDNTNLMHALHPASDVGTERETFFLNQLSVVHDVTYPAKGDFLVDGKFLFEVGGVGKSFSQIADISNSYVVNDDVEIGFGSKIPLWLFGFLY